ncbi:unnamed protein product [Allacma fusca]|uniref:RING-type E3 ubiquitin transferase n=1 Tax=Allacma fusca TaxID=39272 RepID=A0A8J2L1K4_9HEXA|nr:unnamed protein product [Allacma fusca]
MGDPIPFQFECPVCFDPIVPPFNQCTSGHLLCHNCLPRLETCPVCRVAIDKKIRIRNLHLENLAGQFTYPCPFKSLGCEVALQLGEIDNHKLDCPFSIQTYCSIMGIQRCKLLMTTGNIISHLLEKHEISALVSESGDIEIHQVGDISSHYGISKHYWNPVVFTYEGYVFCTQTQYKEGSISWNVVVLGSKAVAKKFTATISIVSFDENRFLEWKGEVASVHTQSTSTGRDYRFSAPISTIANFSRKTEDAEKFWWSRRCNKNNEQWMLKIRVQNKSQNGPESLSQNLPIVKSQASEIGCHCDTDCGCNKPHCFSCGVNFQDEITYRCIKCHMYLLCQACVDNGVHSRHLFFRIPKNRSFDDAIITLKTYGTTEFVISLPPVVAPPSTDDGYEEPQPDIE